MAAVGANPSFSELGLASSNNDPFYEIKDESKSEWRMKMMN